MNCPYCGSNQIAVVTHSRQYNEKHPDKIKRYRRCLICNKGFATIESYLKDYGKPKAYIKVRGFKK